MKGDNNALEKAEYPMYKFRTADKNERSPIKNNFDINKEIKSAMKPNKLDINININEEINKKEDGNGNQANLNSCQDSNQNDLENENGDDEVNISSFSSALDNNQNDDLVKNVNISQLDLDKSTIKDLELSFQRNREKTDGNLVDNEYQANSTNQTENDTKKNSNSDKNKAIEQKGKRAIGILIILILIFLSSLAAIGFLVRIFI